MRSVGVAAVLGLVVLGLLALAATVLGAPTPVRLTWADWVGEYQGRFAWKGCLTPGASRAKVSLDAVDGAMSIELIDAGGGLRAMSLVEEEAGWLAQSGDVKLRMQRPRANALHLDAEIGSDCRMQANLVRATTKIDACDRLIGWTRIENRCGKLGAPPLEDPAKLAKESRSWKARSKADAVRCARRAREVEEMLVTAGCAPLPDPEAFVPGPACQALDQGLARLRRCANLPRDVIEGLEMQMATPRTAGDRATREIVERTCRDHVRLLSTVAANSRCAL